MIVPFKKKEDPFPHILMEARPYCYRIHEESNAICFSKQYKQFQDIKKTRKINFIAVMHMKLYELKK